jgi:hypothetical protein
MPEMSDSVAQSLPPLEGEVFFYFPEREALGGIDPLTLDADRDWVVFGTGVYVWILQTFVRLRQRGAPVRLVETPPPSGLVLVHADQVDRLLADAAAPDDLTIVVAQADRKRHPSADFTIVQNTAGANRSSLFVPHWGQPGLMPRDPRRGTRVETIAYFGSFREAHPALSDPAWAAALDARGLTWDARTITFGGNDRLYPEARWNDYSAVDAIVAVRARKSWGVRHKPASKLQNAWSAGVPAIVSPEHQYRELYRSPLDYLLAESGEDVLAAIETLRANPALYADMIQNGFVRAREFSAERLIERWIDVLWHEIPKRTGTLTHRLLARTRRYRMRARRLGANT